MFGFGKKKPTCDCPTPCDTCKCDPPMDSPSVDIRILPKCPVITKAFMFRITLKYKLHASEETTSSWQWTSDLYYDYRAAVQASYDFVKKVALDLNQTDDKSFAFSIDSCIRKEDVLTVTASNVIEVTFADGEHKSEQEILVNVGENVTLPNPLANSNTYLKA